MQKTKFAQELIETAKLLVSPGKGILAADESNSTLASRFKAIGLESTLETREAYRGMLFTAPGLSKYISGVIQFDETLSQKHFSGESLQSILKSQKIITGIKVDKGVVALSTGEPITTGLDGLAERCERYYGQGCRFAKWRGVLKISENFPTGLAISENASALARYAKICQDSGLVPIVEPEVLCEGSHSIEKCEEVSTIVFSAVVKSLHEHGVLLEGILLKPNMITSGISLKENTSSVEIAMRTIRVLSRTIPPAVPGIVFLSGGQSEEEASNNLNAMNAIPGAKKPWNLSFSFGRALQASCIKAWAGKDLEAGQKALIIRAQANSLATLGKHNPEKSQGESLHVSNYVY